MASPLLLHRELNVFFSHMDMDMVCPLWQLQVSKIPHFGLYVVSEGSAEVSFRNWLIICMF